MFFSVNIIFLNIKFIQLLINIIFIEAALPPGTEDEIVLIEHLPGRQIHLQDFFWTNADDAPSWLDPDQTLNFYETRTIHHTATVYKTDDENEQDSTKWPISGPIDPGCVDCIVPTSTLNDPDQNLGVLVGEDPGPRYWLLTVLRPGESVPPKIELKLARLYRAAFARQQQRHLGLLSNDPRLRRATKGIITTENYNSIINEKNNTSVDTGQLLQKINTTQVKKMRQINISSGNKYFRINRDVENNNLKSTTKTKDNLSSTISILNSNKTTTTVSTDNEIILQSQNDKLNLEEINLNLSTKFTTNNNKDVDVDVDDDVDKNKRKLNLTSDNYKLKILKNELVQIRMQNTSILDDGSTRLIYSVHLDGKPVPAETAAKDMSLISSQEVALELGAPVIVQSEPYLKVPQPLALSRKRDTILLVGAAGASLIILIILIGIIIVVKNKKLQSTVSAPPSQSILKKNTSEYNTPTNVGFDNNGYTSETEERTDGTSQRQMPGGNSRSPDTLIIPNTLNQENHDSSSENDEEDDDVDVDDDDDDDDDDEIKKNIINKRQINDSWNTISENEKRSEQRKITKTNTVEKCESDSMDSLIDQEQKNIKFNKNEFIQTIEETGSTHSYLSMPSCKLFPNMKSVEPLSKILEPNVIRQLDMEFESPEMPRKENILTPRDNKQLQRTQSAYKDPGVIGPIVWDLRRQQKVLSVKTTDIQETDVERQLSSSGPVGRARRRLHELLEDSLNLFGTMKDTKMKDQNAVSSILHPNSMVTSPDHLTINYESRGKSSQVSPVESPTDQMKNHQQTSTTRNLINQDLIIETGTNQVQTRGAWGTRPLSAGPFHRPILPEVNVTRILTDTQLAPEDPAVPLIAAIRKELEKFTPN